jgi:CDP-glycerol glycerophosphotransferase
VVTTAFPSVRDSIPEGAGLVVDQTDDGLVEGMKKFLAGEVPSRRLDWDDYNSVAMRQFYRAIGADAGD